MDYLYVCPAENTPQPGSMYYYAYRQCSDKKVKKLYVLDQLKYEWLKASELYFESYPSLEKLKWWQKALINLEAYRNHPIINNLCTHFTLDQLHVPLTNDLEYALATVAKGRNYQGNLDLSQSFLGIATLKAEIFGFEDKIGIKLLNNLDELLRHILLIGKHFSRNIILDEVLKPDMDKQSFKQIAHKLVTHAQKLKVQLKIPPKRITPLIMLHKQQDLCVKKFIQKINNPFTESIQVSPMALLFSTVFIHNFYYV